MKFLYTIAGLLVCLSAHAMDDAQKKQLKLRAIVLDYLAIHPILKTTTAQKKYTHLIGLIGYKKWKLWEDEYNGADILQELLNNGLNPHIRFERLRCSYNLFYYALPQLYSGEYALELETTEILLKNKLDPNEKIIHSNESTSLPLTRAIKHYYKKSDNDSGRLSYVLVLKLLLLYGADPYLKDEEKGLNSIELAQKNYSVDILIRGTKASKLADILIMGPKAFIDFRMAQLQRAAKKAGLPELPSDMKSEIGRKISALHYAEPQAYELALKKFKEKYPQQEIAKANV